MNPAALTGPSGTSQTPETRGLRQPGPERSQALHSDGVSDGGLDATGAGGGELAK